MRFRTKLFLAWAALVFVVYAASFLPVQTTVATSFREVAQNGFAGTKQSLHGMEAEQVARMRQACELLMNIPELRALIAEAGSELTADNTASLQERLDNFSHVAGVQSIFVMDSRANLIAQSQGSPWHSLPELRRFVSDSPQARALVEHLFTPPDAGAAKAAANRTRDGIWLVGNRLYQTVGVPMTFGSDASDAGATEVEGALVMVTPLTDDLAMELAKRHNCAVSFVVGSHVIASSLPAEQRLQLSHVLAQGVHSTDADFQIQLGETRFRSSFEPLVDDSSLATVGYTLVQSNMSQASRVQSALWRDLALIALAGLVLTGIASFLLSAAVTRPVGSLLNAVREVAGGKLDVSLHSNANGEFRELGNAFDDMVAQLRSRRDLERQVEATRAASHAKSQFLANMSHEIRTPLNGVLGMIDLLQDTPLNDKQKRFAGLIRTSAKILSAVIDDVLDFSKIEAGKIELEALDFDLRSAVSDVAELLRPKAAAKGLNLSVEIANTLPPQIRGDSKRLQQILINLVNNALKFTERGSVTLKALSPPGPDAAAMIRFEVVDTGIGIPPERIHRLFQSFSQVDASTTRKYGGTGLGLAICKQLAELMGGSIGLTSEPGQGSTFWFNIKLTAAAETPTDPAIAAATSVARESQEFNAKTRSRFRILLAEDNEINQIVAVEMLRAAGYACDVAADGRQALAAAVSGQYDLVLMDCQMPVLDGIAATVAIRQHESNNRKNYGHKKRLPVVALTASALSQDRDQCLAAGMDAHCTKPLDRTHLIGTMDSLLLDASRKAEPAAPSSNCIDPSGSPATPAPLSPPPGAGPPIRLPELLTRCMGRAALASEVLHKFERQAASSVDKLRAHLTAAETEQFARVSHTLKGTASLMSADAVTRIARDLEQAANSRNFSQMEEQLRALAFEVQRCTEFISHTPIVPAAEATPTNVP